MKDLSYKDLSLEEQFAWDKCDNEHGFDRTKNRQCYDCKHMISTLERFVKKVLEREAKQG